VQAAGKNIRVAVMNNLLPRKVHVSILPFKSSREYFAVQKFTSVFCRSKVHVSILPFKSSRQYFAVQKFMSVFCRSAPKRCRICRQQTIVPCFFPDASEI